VTSRLLCVLCGVLVLAVGLTVAFVVAPSATGTPGQDTTPTTTPAPPPTTTPPAPDPAPVKKPAPKPAPKPTPTPRSTAVHPASTQASTPAPTYTPPVRTSSPKSSVKTKSAAPKAKPKRSRKARTSGVLASRAVRVRSVGVTAPLAPPKLVAIAPSRGVADLAAIFVAALLALSLLLIGFVAVPMTFIRSHALVHVRWAYGSGIGTVGCALLLIALATLVLSRGGH
jgi:cytoskeletal protein RodZ